MSPKNLRPLIATIRSGLQPKAAKKATTPSSSLVGKTTARAFSTTAPATTALPMRASSARTLPASPAAARISTGMPVPTRSTSPTLAAKASGLGPVEAQAPPLAQGAFRSPSGPRQYSLNRLNHQINPTLKILASRRDLTGSGKVLVLQGVAKDPGSTQARARNSIQTSNIQSPLDLISTMNRLVIKNIGSIQMGK
jgi:hypothetical protein